VRDCDPARDITPPRHYYLKFLPYGSGMRMRNPHLSAMNICKISCSSVGSSVLLTFTVLNFGGW
jgi:hypothetical protein